MLLSRFFPQVDREWRGDFVIFVETGEASEDFLDYIDSHEECQLALEEVFAEYMNSLRAYIAPSDNGPVDPAQNAGLPLSVEPATTALIPKHRRAAGQS